MRVPFVSARGRWLFINASVDFQVKSVFVEVHGRGDKGVAEEEVKSGKGGMVGLQGFNSSCSLVFKRVPLHQK